MPSKSKKKEKQELKKALAKIRKQRAEQIEKEIDEKIEKERKSIVLPDLKRIKGAKLNETAYERLAYYACERTLQEKKLMKKLQGEITKLRKEFLARKITISEFRKKLYSAKHEIAKCEELIKLFEEVQEHALSKLKMFKKVPSIISAMHERKGSIFHQALMERFPKIFRQEKLEQLRALKRELILTYKLSEEDIRKAKLRLGNRLASGFKDLQALEKKAIRELEIARKLSQASDMHWEKQRAAELVATIRNILSGKPRKRRKKARKKVKRS